MSHVVPISTDTHDRRRSIEKNNKEKGTNIAERKEKTRRRKKGKERKKRQDKEGEKRKDKKKKQGKEKST